ncbi:MAG TPA: C40 family peptidase [Flavisolibacter sp.]|nr:C40 family peptidase [Flavisolibacter sp.]
MKTFIFAIALFFIAAIDNSCKYQTTDKETVTKLSSTDSLPAFRSDTIKAASSFNDTLADTANYFNGIDTKKVKPKEVVAYATKLIGIPYRYGSTDPEKGFDCSGFITYLFQHFDINVPRSSIDFTNVGKPVDLEKSRYGDLILFTGTDSLKEYVGHMGMIVKNENGVVEFIHSTSGKSYGVTITPFNDYYNSRYIKTIRIFPEKSW